MGVVTVEGYAPAETHAAVLPGRAIRAALRVVQVGAIAAVLAASIHRTFELDRFLVPKELALHLTAVPAGLFAIGRIRRTRLTGTDWLLLLYLLIGVASAVLATNPWLAIRAMAVSVSGLLLFWVGRGLRDAGLARSLLNAIAFAVVLAAVTSLLQAYGVRIELFSMNRSPGGTFGNRNFVAHVAAFGLGVCLFSASRARSAFAYLAGSIGIGIVSGTLVLTRSRAAWLAAAAVILVYGGTMILAPALRRDGRSWGRIFGVLLFAGGGVAAALLIPNTLRWRSDNPYLDSVAGIADYQEGSGRGRLLQYERSLRLAARNPVFGVGPGNWPVQYPEHVPRNDPSLDDSEPGTTLNPWPSSDWVAFVAERGFAAAALMVLVFLAIMRVGLRNLFGAIDPETALGGATLLATVVAAGVAGIFDAVLLLAGPALLVWTAVGALFDSAPEKMAAQPRTIPAIVVVVLLAGSALGAVRSAAQLVSMEIYSTHGDRGSLTLAARIDPGNYRVRLRLARSGSRKQRCQHARAAHRLFPHAAAARDLAARCD